jgi:hypothetical protein
LAYHLYKKKKTSSILLLPGVFWKVEKNIQIRNSSKIEDCFVPKGFAMTCLSSELGVLIRNLGHFKSRKPRKKLNFETG